MPKTNFFYRITFLILFVFVTTSAFRQNKDLPKEILKYTNDYRRSKGKPGLEMKTDLNAIAQNHSEAMANGSRSFGHGGFDQRVLKIKKIFKSCNVAENVAYGASNAKEVFTTWKNSSDHRKNMLGNYRYVGIGIARNKHGIIYYTEIFVR